MLRKLPARPTYDRFTHELLLAGFRLEMDDLSWRHRNGGMASVEAIEDIVALYSGLAGVFLKILKSGRSFDVRLDEDGDGLGATLRVESQPLLDQIVGEIH
jgi:hypothetical protein